MPQTPQQNGVEEGINKTLVEAVCLMLSDAKFPKNFWAKAVSTAMYLHNCSPTTAVPEKTPFEAWTKEKSDVGHSDPLVVPVRHTMLRMSNRSLMIRQENVSC